MKVRVASPFDIPNILEILLDAKKEMNQNNIPQWQTGYPNAANIMCDIKNEEGLVAVLNEEIVGYAAFVIGDDPNYQQLLSGKWTVDSEIYGTVHRMVTKTSAAKLGVASFLLQNIEDKCKQQQVADLRIDTHHKNTPMQNFIQKHQFVYCGETEMLLDKSKRDVFQKILY